MTANRLGIVRDAPGNSPTRHSKRERKLLETAREDKNISDTFRQALIMSNMDNADGTVYTGATAEVLAIDSGKAIYEVYQAAVNSAAVVTPYTSASGLELKPVAAADALELTNGTTSLSRAAFTVGTDADFFCEATITIDDISDVTEIFYGFRKAEAYAADPDSYDAVAAFHIGATDDGRISITTSVASTETVVDTTLTDWVDDVAGTGTHTLKIIVRKSGRVEFLFDGAAPTVTVTSFSFTAAEVVVPFLHLNTETGDPGLSISSWKVGRL